MTIREHGPFIVVIVIGALLGACVNQAVFFRFMPFPESLHWENWMWSFALEGAIAGALVANLLWMTAHPRRLRRSAAIAVAVNTLVWIAFLVVTPKLTSADFEAIQAERIRIDADSDMDLATHEPVIVAARMLGSYGAEERLDRLLGLFAGPAITWAAMVIVPVEYGTSRATRRESYYVAIVAFTLSTAFWLAFAPALSSGVRRLRRLRRERTRP
jgi:hypothetical protein